MPAKLIVTMFIVLLGAIQADILTPEDLGWLNNLTEAKEQAVREKKPIILFLHSRRCFYCPKMIEEVFPNPKVKTFLEKNFVRLSLDVATGSDSIEEDASDQAPERFIVNMTPAFVYMGPKEEKLYRKGRKHMIIYGYWKANDFVKWGREALKRFDRLYGKRYGGQK
jgi:thioredoxin-related protein